MGKQSPSKLWGPGESEGRYRNTMDTRAPEARQSGHPLLPKWSTTSAHYPPHSKGRKPPTDRWSPQLLQCGPLHPGVTLHKPPKTSGSRLRGRESTPPVDQAGRRAEPLLASWERDGPSSQFLLFPPQTQQSKCSPLNSVLRNSRSCSRPKMSPISSLKPKLQRSTRSLVGIVTLQGKRVSGRAAMQFGCSSWLEVWMAAIAGEAIAQIQFVCQLCPFLDLEALLTVSHILVGQLQCALQGAALEDHLEIRAATEFLQSIGHLSAQLSYTIAKRGALVPKVLVITLHGTRPSYLQNCCSLRISACPPGQTVGMLPGPFVKCCHLVRSRKSAFSIMPVLWNTVPLSSPSPS